RRHTRCYRDWSSDVCSSDLTTTQEGGVLGSGGSIGGTRPRFNGFSIDGVDDNRADVNGPNTPVIQDSVAEFTLLTNQFSAENGRSEERRVGKAWNGGRSRCD